MLIETGSKLMVVHRRLFPEDHARFFVGTVEFYDSGIARVRGHTWAKDILTGVYYRKEDIREKIISLSTGTLITYVLPDDVDMSRIRLDSRNDRLILSDQREFSLDLTEYEPRSRVRKETNHLR